MKILCVNPPTLDNQKFIREGRCMQSVNSWAAIWPPLTLAILATIAKKYGEVRLIDWNVEKMSSDTLVQTVVAFEPDILVSCPTFPSIDSDAFFSKKIKEQLPRTITLGFGMFFTLLEEASLRDTEGYDVAIYGEPEVTFDEVLSNYAVSGKIEPIQGLLWREGTQVKKGEPRP